MNLNFEPLFSAISKSFLFLDFSHKFQKFSTPIDWKLSKTIKTLVFEAVLVVKSTKEWKKLKKKSIGWEAAIDPNSILTTYFPQSRKFFIFQDFSKIPKPTFGSTLDFQMVSMTAP